MRFVPELFRRQELSPGEDLLNHGKSEIMFETLPGILKCFSFDWVLIYHKFCFPGLSAVSPGYSSHRRSGLETFRHRTAM